MDRRKSRNGSGEFVEMAMLLPMTLLGSGGSPGDDKDVDASDDDNDSAEEEESMMELERPGEEKKKRCDAKMVAKSGVEASSESDSDEERRSSVKDLERVVQKSKVES